MYTVTVYTTPNCIRCDITCRALGKAGINHRTVDVAADPAAREYVTAELDYTEAPVVVVDPGHRPPLVRISARQDKSASSH